MLPGVVMQFDVHKLMQKIVSSIIVRSIRIAVIHLFGVAVQHLHTLRPQSVHTKHHGFYHVMFQFKQKLGQPQAEGSVYCCHCNPQLEAKEEFSLEHGLISSREYSKIFFIVLIWTLPLSS